MIAPQELEDLLHHKDWLQKKLAANAKTYLDLLEKLSTAKPESDAYATLDARLYAQAAQLEMDAHDVVEVMDNISDQLPEDDEPVSA